MKRLMKLVVTLAAMFSLAFAGAAFAQAPVGDGYNPNNEQGVLDEVDQIPPPQERVPKNEPLPEEEERREAGAPRVTGSLPFTGLDVGLLALGGVAMLGVGVGLRRMSRSAA